MPVSRLNLSALRSGASPYPADRPTPAELISSSDERFTLTRREMLGVMGYLGAAPVLNTVGTTFLGSIEVVSSKTRVAFKLRGKERWVVDTRRFGGHPRLSLSREGHTLHLALSNAEFPGTRYPADFDCLLRPTLRGWRMHLTMGGGFDYRGAFEPWLTGFHPARSKVDLDTQLGRSALDPPPVRVKGRAEAAFLPDWTLRLAKASSVFDRIARPFSPAALVRAELPGGRLEADQISLSLQDKGAPTLLNRRVARRTLVTVERGDRAWDLTPKVTDAPEWSFASEANAFDRLRIELGESRSGHRYTALVATSDDDRAARVAVVPSPKLAALGGTPFALPLRRARYAVAFDAAGHHTAVTARFAGSAWLHTPEFSLELGEHPEPEQEIPFTLTGVKGNLERLDGAPALLRTLVPLAGSDTISGPAPVRPGTRLTLSAGPRRPSRKTAPNQVHVGSRTPPRFVLDAWSTDVLRPRDLVVLRFEFDGMTKSGGNVTANGPASYLIAHFQGQNIAEEAFFEASQNTELDSNDPDDGNASDPLDPPPVRARLAGESRLAFKVPAGTSIPYTLEGLLQACGELELSVAQNALPPPRFNGGLMAGIMAGIINDGADELADDQLKVTDKGAGVPLLRALKNASKETSDQIDVTNGSKLIRMQRDKTIVRNSALVNVSGQVIARLEDDDAIIGPAQRIPNVRPPIPQLPSARQTAIEAPWRLIQSPNKYGAWAHAVQPVASSQTGRTELWHTRLGTRRAGEAGVDEESSFYRTTRAIWYLDPRQNSDKENPNAVPAHSIYPPFRISLDAFDRHNIVHLSSNFRIEGFTPGAIGVRRLMLSALGAWQNTRGVWKPPQDVALSVEEWLHRGTLGRDHYVKVVYQGRLFPFGHRASLIKITERKFEDAPSGAQTGGAKIAYLRQRMFIVVREPLVAAGLSQVTNKDGERLDLKMPFKSIRIVDERTPLLDPPKDSDIGNRLQSLFWPRVHFSDFRFSLKLEDVEGAVHDVTMPLAFVGKEILNLYPDGSSDPLDVLISYYNDPSSSPDAAAYEERSTPSFHGQSVTLAETKTPGDTTFEAETVSFMAEKPDPNAKPWFTPAVRACSLVIPAARHLTGTGATDVAFGKHYLNHGFPDPDQPAATDDVAELFLEVTSSTEMSFSDAGTGDRSGGLVQPNIGIKAVSREKGPSGLDSSAAFDPNNFKPKDFFGEAAGPLLFGTIPLFSIIDELAGLDGAPSFLTEAMNDVETFIKTIEGLQAQSTDIKDAVPNATNVADLVDGSGGSPSLVDLMTNVLSEIGNLTQS